MTEQSVVPEDTFERVLKGNLEGTYERALEVFRNYGERFLFDVINVLMHAVNQGKVDKVLQILETYWENSLQYRNAEIHAQTGNVTQALFLDIHEIILKLEPTQP